MNLYLNLCRKGQHIMSQNLKVMNLQLTTKQSAAQYQIKLNTRGKNNVHVCLFNKSYRKDINISNLSKKRKHI